MTTPFDGKLLWWHWQGSVVEEDSIEALVERVKRETPNVTGIVLKTSNGGQWQGVFDIKPSMAVMGTDDIAKWVQMLKKYDLETHLWCVVHGKHASQEFLWEAPKIIEACIVDGVRSMILDVEGDERYFGSHPPQVAQQLITTIREYIPQDFHLGLCFFAREDEMAAIHFEEWLPFVQSLHPMIYHWDFSSGTKPAKPYIDEAFDLLEGYGLPIVPILGTYDDPETEMPVPEEHVYEAGLYAFEQGAVGLSFFRWGAASDGAIRAVGRIEVKD